MVELVRRGVAVLVQEAAEGLGEGLAVPGGEGGGAADGGAGVAQVHQQVAQGEAVGDVGGGEFLAAIFDDASTARDGGVGERDILRDDEIAGGDVFDNPIIDGVGAFGDADDAGAGHGAILHGGGGDVKHAHAVAARGAVELILDRAGVGVDIDRQVHRGILKKAACDVCEWKHGGSLNFGDSSVESRGQLPTISPDSKDREVVVIGPG